MIAVSQQLEKGTVAGVFAVVVVVVVVFGLETHKVSVSEYPINLLGYGEWNQRYCLLRTGFKLAVNYPKLYIGITLLD